MPKLSSLGTCTTCRMPCGKVGMVWAKSHVIPPEVPRPASYRVEVLFQNGQVYQYYVAGGDDDPDVEVVPHHLFQEGYRCESSSPGVQV